MEDRENKRNALLQAKLGLAIAGRYRLVQNPKFPNATQLEPLGRGGSGVVFLAEQLLADGVSVLRAVKFCVYRDDVARIPAHQHSGNIGASTFRDELVNLSGINHENIVKVIEAGYWSSPSGAQVPYIVTDYVNGPTLREAIANRALTDAMADSPQLLIDLLLDLCRGVGHLHSRHFYHCDIAPKNIFVIPASQDYRLVIGDLGLGKTISPGDRSRDKVRFLNAGTKDFAPPEVQSHVNQEITFGEFRRMQPRWDLYATAKTALEIVNQVAAHGEPSGPWLDALLSMLLEALELHRVTAISELEQRIRLLHPGQYTIFDVPELSESASPFHRPLLPVDQVQLSPRVRELTHHPSLLRLKRVPQLVLASRILHSGNHTRYEHSLGAYQNMRRYLAALLREQTFLQVFTPAHVELALVAALLSSITRFPFSTIVHELRQRDKSLFARCAQRDLLEDLLDDTYGGRKNETLRAVIRKHFRRVDIGVLCDLITGAPIAPDDVCCRAIRFALSSSIDVRVVDYIRRDAHHLGLSRDVGFALEDLVPHLRFQNGRIMLRSSGMNTVEQVVAMRYWLYHRVYWNQPNRAMIAMVRHAMWCLVHKSKSFERKLREMVLDASEEDMLNFLLDCAREAELVSLEEIFDLLLRDRPDIFREVLQYSRAEDDAGARVICDRFEGLPLSEQIGLQDRINVEITRRFRLPSDRIHVLLDLPVEYGSLKLGEDLDIQSRMGDVRPMAKMSGIVTGVLDGFRQHIQRFRVFVNPKSLTQNGNRLPQITETIRQILAT